MFRSCALTYATHRVPFINERGENASDDVTIWTRPATVKSLSVRMYAFHNVSEEKGDKNDICNKKRPPKTGEAKGGICNVLQPPQPKCGKPASR